MVSHCANSECQKKFLRFDSGKLFHAPMKQESKLREWYWLCGECSQKFRLEFSRGGVPELAPLITRGAA
jgi:hypothetical protein